MRNLTKIMALVCLLVLAATLSACGYVSGQEHDKTLADLNSAQLEIQRLQGELTAKGVEIAGLKNDLTKQANELELIRNKAAQFEQTTITQAAKIAGLERRLENLLSSTVEEDYSLVYTSHSYHYTLPVSLRTFSQYIDKARPASFAGNLMANDPGDDEVISSLVRYIDSSIAGLGFNQLEKADFVATLVQSMSHTERDVRVPYDAYTRYPVENLLARGGDSEDNAILTAALLKAMGYDVVLLVFEQQKHVAVGVNITYVLGFYWENQGKPYYYLETTGNNWKVGMCPFEYQQATPRIYPVGS